MGTPHNIQTPSRYHHTDIPMKNYITSYNQREYSISQVRHRVGGWVVGWLGGWVGPRYIIMPLCGSILQAETC